MWPGAWNSSIPRCTRTRWRTSSSAAAATFYNKAQLESNYHEGKKWRKVAEREETMISADALLSCSLSFPALHSTQFFKRTTDTQPPPLLQSASSSNRGRPRNHTHTQKRTVLLPRRPIPACNQPKSAVCVHIETGKRWAHSPKKEKKRKRCYIRTERKREYHKI